MTLMIMIKWMKISWLICTFKATQINLFQVTGQLIWDGNNMCKGEIKKIEECRIGGCMEGE